MMELELEAMEAALADPLDYRAYKNHFIPLLYDTFEVGDTYYLARYLEVMRKHLVDDEWAEQMRVERIIRTHSLIAEYISNFEGGAGTWHLFLSGYPEAFTRKALLPLAIRELDLLALAWIEADNKEVARRTNSTARYVRLMNMPIVDALQAFHFGVNLTIISYGLENFPQLDLRQEGRFHRLVPEYLYALSVMHKIETGSYPRVYEDLELSPFFDSGALDGVESVKLHHYDEARYLSFRGRESHYVKVKEFLNGRDVNEFANEEIAVATGLSAEKLNDVIVPIGELIGFEFAAKQNPRAIPRVFYSDEENQEILAKFFEYDDDLIREFIMFVPGVDIADVERLMGRDQGDSELENSFNAEF